MEKARLDLDILLPELPDERDACVNRVIESLRSTRGVEKVHIIPGEASKKPQLCFHYNPDEISAQKITQMAKQAGAEITEHYGHLLIHTSGIRHPRQARVVEARLQRAQGIQQVSVSGTGFIRLEYKKDDTSIEAIITHVRNAGLTIKEIDDFHVHQPKGNITDPATNDRAARNDTHQLPDSSPQTSGRANHNHAGAEHSHAAEHSGTAEHSHAGEHSGTAEHSHAGEHSHVAAHSGTAEHSHAAGAHQHGSSDHTHANGIFGPKTELIFAVICGSLLALGFALSFANAFTDYVATGCYIAAYFFGGFYTTKEAAEGLRQRRFEIDFLMLVAAVGAAFLGQWAEGALLLFLFSLGHSLEHYAMEKARKSISALAELTPKTALVKKGDDVKEMMIEELATGDIIVVKPNSKIAADGIVVSGNSSVNQAPITGESVPVDKSPAVGIGEGNADVPDAAYFVFAGSINGNGVLEVQVTKIAADSTIARLVKLVNEAQTQKSPTQTFADKLEKYYVPSVLILVLLLLFAFLVIDEPFAASFYRAMAVLIAASPCALAISTPSAVLSGVARAARGGVLIKGGRPLEELGSLTAIAFDKTGTLTEGKPKLTGVYPLNGIVEAQLLRIVIAVEKLSDHPLAAAIVKGGMERLKKDVPAVSNVVAIQGRGVKADFEGTTVHIGNKELFTDKQDQLPDHIKEQVTGLESQGNTTMVVQQNEKYIGIITLMDVARSDAKSTLAQLRKMGIRKMIMLTGDNQKVAEAIAKEIGITEALGNLMPEEKVVAIENLRSKEKKVAMVGDGVNDAPAMAKSTVGIAMGAAGSDVALETADIALMADNLSNLPFAIGLSKQAHKIIKQNLVISLGMVVILIPLTISGIAHIGPAVIGHEGSTLVVVFNALRLLAYKK